MMIIPPSVPSIKAFVTNKATSSGVIVINTEKSAQYEHEESERKVNTQHEPKEKKCIHKVMTS